MTLSIHPWFPAALLILSFATKVTADEPAQARVGSPFRNDRVDRSIDKAVKYLSSMQDEDGTAAGAINDSYNNLTAMTSLSIMAMAAVGHQPADPTPEGRALARALDYVLKDDNLHRGYYFGGDGSRMYGHGITTLMLGEMLGMAVDDDQDRVIRHRLGRAVKLILVAQQVDKDWHNRGGWRYSPSSGDSDLSVTVWQVMALRSAKNAGLDVPKEAISAAVSYLRRCYNEHHDAFAYQPGGHPVYSTAAAGLLSMQVCGEYDADEVKNAADWLLRRDLDYHNHWFFYGTYYYSQGMYQRKGDHAKKARRRVEDLLLQHQSSNGSWHAGSGQERSAGRVYSTAMAILSLSVKYHYLPIYQR